MHPSPTTTASSSSSTRASGRRVRALPSSGTAAAAAASGGLARPSSRGASPNGGDSEASHNDASGEEQQQQQQPDEQPRSSASSSSSSRRQADGGGSSRLLSIDDAQLVVGDCIALLAAALYRQIAAIVTSPSFAGWFAPLAVNPVRLLEFADFAAMLLASWVVAATLTGGYSGAAIGAGVPAALRAACRAWLVAMPLCAAQLVLVTVSESQSLVGEAGFAGVLPLAAQGPGEPLGTAAALLGLMAMWRGFYAAYLDAWAWAGTRDPDDAAVKFREALAAVALVAAGCVLLLQVLQRCDGGSGATSLLLLLGE